MNLLTLLTTANAEEAFVSELKEVVSLDDPRFGRFSVDELASYYAKFQALIKDYEAKIEEVNSIELADSQVEELQLYLQKKDQTIRLPVAVVYDYSDQGLHVRLYFSNGPIDQTHRDRAAMLAANPDLTLPGPIARYQKAFAQGNVDAMLDSVEPTATVREPGGGTFGPSPGQTSLKDFYTFLFSFGGGIVLQRCNAITNGKSCAIEYNVLKVGNNTYSPKPGIGIYDFNKNKVTGARLYDDFVP